MPRRNQRTDTPTPLSITPRDIPRPRRIRTVEEARREREERDRRALHEKIAARRERRNAAMRWHTCLVPECDDPPFPGQPENADIRLPLCAYHETMVWRRVQQNLGRPDLVKASDQLAAEAAEREEAERQKRLANRDGHIYYLRTNGLIKVGWSRSIHDRLRAYGPEVEVLCYHAGSRDDETNLHRNLRPYLARGREWYEDCDAMRDIIAKAVARHGQPLVYDEWTRPKPAVIKPRAWRGSV